MGQDDERTGDVLGRGETAAGVAATRLVDQRVVAGNFLRGRGRRHAGPDRVDRDAARGQLHSELTHVGFERGLGRRHRPVRRQHAAAARRRQGEDATALGHEPARDDLLRPVHERVRHHVDRHVHLSGAHRFLDGIGDEGLERPEGERVEQHGQVAVIAARRHRARHLLQHFGATVGVGRVDVEEAGLAAEAFDRGHDALDVGEGGLAVEVDAEDIEAGPRQRDARCFTEARRGTEHERPAAEPDGSRLHGLAHSTIV